MNFKEASTEPSQAANDTKLTKEYLITYFEKSKFVFGSPDSLKTTTVFTGTYIVPESDIKIIVDIHEEKDNLEVSLLELTIDASAYSMSSNQTEASKQIDKLASEFFSTVVQVPYPSSEPEKAKSFVVSHATKANLEGQVYFEEIGDATINLYGSPFLRFLEIDMGYSKK